jgi:hypothetical protein
MRAAASKPGRFSSVAKYVGEERLWLLRWATLGFVGNKILVYAAAAVGMRARFAAQTGSGFLHYLFVQNFIQWDSWWFTGIAQNGYSAKSTAFYPLYPLLIRAVSEVLRISLAAAAVLVSTVCFFLGLYFLLKLLLLDLERPRAVRGMLLLALFPTAFYFSAAYTEALFFLLAVLLLYALRKRRWASAGIWGGLAAVARNTGIAFGLPFLIEYFQDWWKKPRPRPRPWQAAWVALVALGTLAYLVFCWVKFGSPLSFISAEGQWGRSFALPWTTLYEGFKHNLGWAGGLRLSLHQDWSPVYYTTELLFPAGAIVVLVASIKKMRWSYWIILLYSIVVPLMMPANGQVLDYFVSFSRYMLVVVPLFIGLERLLRNRWAFWVYLACSVVLLLVLTYAFSEHRWVA